MLKKLSGLKVEGDPNKVDSFAACLTAAASFLGEPASLPGKTTEYRFVEALTGTSFSPCHNQGEECIGWMMDGGNAYRVEFMAGALGLGLQKITLNPEVPFDWAETYKPGDALLQQVETYFEALKGALEGGAVVVVATWPAWSVLLGWDEDLSQLPFATIPGFEPVVGSIWPPIRSRLAFAFSKSEDQLPREVVLRESLKFGARVAAAPLSLQVEGFDAENAYGGAMYDFIIERTEHEHLCPGCGEDGCFDRTAKRLNDGHKSSAEFLDAAVKHFGDELLQDRLEVVKGKYESMAEISGRYLDWRTQPDTWAIPQTRQQIAADFKSMKTLHYEAAGLLQALVGDL